MLSFNPANAQWPFQMFFSSMHYFLHVPISLVTKVLEVLNWNGEVFPCRKSKVGQVSLGLTDPASPSSQLKFVLWEITSKTFEKIHTVEQQGACTVFEGDSEHPVLTDSRTNSVNILNSGFALSQLSVELTAAQLQMQTQHFPAPGGCSQGCKFRR